MADPDVTLFLGLPQSQRQQAARIYWDSFGSKLGTVLGPEPRALRFLERVMRGDLCLTAQGPDGRLLGLAGFKSPHGNFAGGTVSDLVAIYGWLGSRWRIAALWLLGHDVDNDRFLIDGICVDRGVRGKGIGTALLHRLYDEAARRGYGAVRLDVVDTNLRARALYQREGFVAERTERLGLLRHVFGFSSTITMVRPLD